MSRIYNRGWRAEDALFNGSTMIRIVPPVCECLQRNLSFVSLFHPLDNTAPVHVDVHENFKCYSMEYSHSPSVELLAVLSVSCMKIIRATY